MNDTPIAMIDSFESLRDAIRGSTSILVVGNRSKPALSSVDPQTQRVCTTALSGITQYEPSEFTFTALAGTTIAEINNVLAEKNQYLPFDPMLVGQNATIGGTLAAGTSGPGRHRYGGVRDFVLGAQFIAGDGQLIQSGGKVVKNAAGFDIPKLLVGSCGRLGAITALTFKVFPRPPQFHSYRIQCTDHQSAAGLIASLARGRWELDAIDYQTKTRAVWMRIGGEQSVCDLIAADIDQSIGELQVLSSPDDQASPLWTSLVELQFAEPHQNNIIKVPLNLESMQRLATWCDQHHDDACLHASVAASVGWLAVSDHKMVDAESLLRESCLTGLVVRGATLSPNRILIGKHEMNPIDAAVKRAMDPPSRFPNFSS